MVDDSGRGIEAADVTPSAVQGGDVKGVDNWADVTSDCIDDVELAECGVDSDACLLRSSIGLSVSGLERDVDERRVYVSEIVEETFPESDAGALQIEWGEP